MSGLGYTGTRLDYLLVAGRMVAAEMYKSWLVFSPAIAECNGNVKNQDAVMLMPRMEAAHRRYWTLWREKEQLSRRFLALTAKEG